MKNEEINIPGMLHLYQSFPYYKHKVFKYKGMIKLEKKEFWYREFTKDNCKVIIFDEYKGDRVVENGTVFSESVCLNAPL